MNVYVLWWQDTGSDRAGIESAYTEEAEAKAMKERFLFHTKCERYISKVNLYGPWPMNNLVNEQMRAQQIPPYR